MEMTRLIEMLNNAGIPYSAIPHWSGTIQICYPIGPAGTPDCVCDVISFYGSYGGMKGLLEIAGLTDKELAWDDVEGWLTAEEVFNRINEHYKASTAESVQKGR